MNEIKKQIMESLGMLGTSITFKNPKKVIWDSGSVFGEEIIENVTSIDIIHCANHTSVEVICITEDGHESSSSTAVQNIKKLEVID